MILDPWLYFFMALFSVPGSHLCQQRSSVCTEEYNPVCATFPCYGFDYCTKTYANPCIACQDTKVIAYRPGDCRIPGGPHQNFPGNVNDFDDSPICSFYLVDDRGVFTEDYEDNSEADNIPMFFYIPGKCKNIDRTVCTASDRNEVCTAENKPVCAYDYDTNGGKKFPAKISFSTKSNACQACNDRSVDFYVKGACKTTPAPPKTTVKVSKKKTSSSSKSSSKSKKVN